MNHILDELSLSNFRSNPKFCHLAFQVAKIGTENVTYIIVGDPRVRKQNLEGKNRKNINPICRPDVSFNCIFLFIANI